MTSMKMNTYIIRWRSVKNPDASLIGSPIPTGLLAKTEVQATSLEDAIGKFRQEFPKYDYSSTSISAEREIVSVELLAETAASV